MNIIKLHLLCTAIVGISVSQAAAAQTVKPENAAMPDAGGVQGTPSPSSENSYGDIVVTAQKRSENINKVGLAITAISGDTLKSRQITSLADIANAVPGLTFSNSATNTPIYTLRGVGFTESSLGAYPDVAVYLDEVPLPFPVLTTLTAFDLQRIEVLKGPQGTLFGNNATGGAINYIASKPTDKFEAGANMSYGRFNTIDAEGYISGPISSNLAARLSGKIVHGDDWQHGYTNDATIGKARQYSGRLLLDWQASSKLRFELNLNGWKDQSDPEALQFQLYRSNLAPLGINAAPGVVNYPRAPDNPRAADFSPGSFADNRFLQAAVRVTYELTDSVKLTSLSSYIDYRHHQAFDQDGQTLQDFDIIDARGNIQSSSQELRLDNGSSGRFRWIVGGNYEHDHVYDYQLYQYVDSSAALGLGVLGGAAVSNQRMNNYAGFANAEFDILPTLTLKAGGRYTEADRHYVGCTLDVDGEGLRQLFQYLASQASGTAVPPAPANGCSTIRPDYKSLGNFVDQLDEHNFSYRAGLDFKPNGNTLLFANIAKGYKAGSFPTAAASTTVQFLPVKQESVLDYEAGFKLTLADRAIQLNGTAFYYDYRNKQLRSKIIDPVFGLLDNLQNVPKSSVKGAEVELTVRPFPGASIAAAGTYLDAKIKKFSGYNAGGVFANFAGSRVPFTPKYQLSVNPSYEFKVSDRLVAFFGANINYRSATNAIVGGSDILVNGQDVYKINAYTLIDGQIGIRSSDHGWQAQLWAKNIANKYYWTNVLVAYDTISRYAGRPATYGVSVSLKF